VHVEAGLRSFNTKMPEEINRVITDRLSSLLFCPDDLSIQNLKAEGITTGVHNVGDIMVDQIKLMLKNIKQAKPHEKKYIFLTLHRQETCDSPSYLRAFLQNLNDISGGCDIIFPVHPRVKNLLKALDLRLNDNFLIINPLGHMDTISYIQSAEFVVTDSGGVQKESYILSKPCITVRTETEWSGTMLHGWNKVVGLDIHAFNSAYQEAQEFDLSLPHPSLYGDGNTANMIISKMVLICR
jgi:UDP-GlcNAc3NAcA epimerase